MYLIKLDNEYVNLDAIFAAKIEPKVCQGHLPYKFHGRLANGDTFSIDISGTEADRLKRIFTELLLKEE